MNALTLPIADSVSTLLIVVAVGYFVLGIDDLAMDFAFWLRRAWRTLFARGYTLLTVERLRDLPQQRIAIFVPCWHEAEVIERVLRFAVESIEYRHYEILVGVYPNDLPTIERVNAVNREYPHVRAVINSQSGPTTKGQNLNSVFKKMREFERDDPFKIVVLHDAEDMIHPFSLMIYNLLIPRKGMIQLPVFPLEYPVRKWTAWTYADEFAEAHLKDLQMRESLGGFVPSAGVGCAFDRCALEKLSLARDEVFPSESLTEDYVMGLRLSTQGSATVLVQQLLRQPRKLSEFVNASSYVATREYFPDSFKTAIRQKRRWALGICFQAWQTSGWVGGPATRYALYRDRKGIISNPLTLFGYALTVCCIALFAGHAIDADIAVPTIGNNRLLWALFDFVLVLSMLRAVQKCYFVSVLYGPIQGLLSIARIPWAGVINGIATTTAGYAFVAARIHRRKLTWQKTSHAFPNAENLGKST